MTVRFDVHPVNPQERYLNKAAEQLAGGGLGLCPTDAGYTLVWSLEGREAEERVRRLRQLDSKHPFTVLCRQLSEAGRLARLDDPAFRLMRSLTPGPWRRRLQQAARQSRSASGRPGRKSRPGRPSRRKSRPGWRSWRTSRWPSRSGRRKPDRPAGRARRPSRSASGKQPRPAPWRTPAPRSAQASRRPAFRRLRKRPAQAGLSVFRHRDGLQNRPAWKSCTACMISCCVFITNGP